MNEQQKQALLGAVCDGFWAWWAEALPEVLQVEFSGVQLWIPPRAPDRPPGGRLAIRFEDPACVGFLARSAALADDWPREMSADELEPFAMSGEEVVLGDATGIREVLKRARRIDRVFGAEPEDFDWESAPAKMGFWAGSAGLVVAAAKLQVVTHEGDLDHELLPDLHTRWWAYHREYWERKDGPDPLPYDVLCEITIPVRSP